MKTKFSQTDKISVRVILHVFLTNGPLKTYPVWTAIVQTQYGLLSWYHCNSVEELVPIDEI